MLPHLKRDGDLSIILVFHRKSDDDTTLVDILTNRTNFQVKEIEDKEVIANHTIYVAPPDYHVLIERDFSFSLDYSEKVNYSRPSLDITFESAAAIFGDSLVGLLLSGANADGVEGLRCIKKRGGIVAVQDPATAEVAYMPQKAMDNVAVDIVMSGNRIEDFMQKLPHLFQR